MKSIQIIHLGDVHFPQNRRRQNIDLKDSAVPRALSATLASTTIRTVVRKIQTLQASNPESALLISGDLTSWGDVRGYESCVSYLVTGLDLKAKDPSLVHVVPGNHDVDRALCARTRPTIGFKKFRALSETWINEGLDLLAATRVRETVARNGTAEVSLLSLNSCVGCGEWRHLPTDIRTQLRDRLRRVGVGRSRRRAFNLLGEQLDTPLFDAEHLDNLHDTITALPVTRVPIVLAHHNLLPQATPRVAIYTELLNGGSVRQRLTSLNRPIIYCHGHIHERTVEVISDPSCKNSRLILVSAPEIIDGFNTLQINFSATDDPIGLEVRRYSVRSDGSLDESTIRVPLQSRYRARSFLPPETIDLLQAFPSSTTSVPELIRAFPTTTGSARAEADIASLLLQAEWFSLLEIENRCDPCRYWSVRSLSQ